MAALYPSLHEKFRNERICPICLIEMGQGVSYTCENDHILCSRCKPYYYGCPTCFSPLTTVEPPPQTNPYGPPPPTHYMPHPPSEMHAHQPTAPSHDDFIHHERTYWEPSAIDKNEELLTCPYSYNGCWAKFPIYLRDLHVTRCQFRPDMEEEHLPTDLRHNSDELVVCRYQNVGCNVRMPVWRKEIHENLCIYKDRKPDDVEGCLNSMSLSEDSGRLVECKFKKYGCMVRMPLRRKCIHEEKCNYRKYDEDNSSYDSSQIDPDALVPCKWTYKGCRVTVPYCRKTIHEEKCNYRAQGECCVSSSSSSSSAEELDPETRIPCRWASRGCRMQPKLERKETHEAKCNYRLVECKYKSRGCMALVEPPRKHIHEGECEYAAFYQ